jgi:hypothetical protein
VFSFALVVIFAVKLALTCVVSIHFI